MFKNVGKVIKAIAIIQFVFWLVIGLVFGVGCMIGLFGMNSRAGGYFLTGNSGLNVMIFILGFIVYMALVFIVAYTSVMLLYAFGSLVDDVKSIKERLNTTGGTSESIGSPTYGTSSSTYGASGSGYGTGAYGGETYTRQSPSSYTPPAPTYNPPSDNGGSSSKGGGSGLKMNF